MENRENTEGENLLLLVEIPRIFGYYSYTFFSQFGIRPNSTNYSAKYGTPNDKKSGMFIISQKWIFLPINIKIILEVYRK